VNFQATLELDGQTATGITVPSAVMESLGVGKRPAVSVTINGFTFSTSVGTVKGKSKIPVSAERRRQMHAKAGDILLVSITLEAAPPEVETPKDFARALASDKNAEDLFASLTSSQRKGFIAPILETKSSETRTRRIDKALAALRAGQKRP
jgi:Bacteriocin-protection, YdeI or OmpD-Associated/Domain of unknown function (DUF1905)